MEDKYIISETYLKKGESFYFKFIGKEAKNSEYELKISNLLDKSFTKIRTFQDIKKVIFWLRTILKVYEEEYLCVNIHFKNKETQVEYKKKKLISFETKEIVNQIEILNVSYKRPLSSMAGAMLNIKENDPIKNFDTNIKDITQLISSLDTYEIKEELYPNEQHICDLYKLFYGQDPDFTKVETDTRIQAMFYILNNFYLDFSYDFDTPFEGSLFPCSLKLMQELKDLVPLGKVVIDEKEIKIQDFQKRKVKMIGEKVRKEIQNSITALMQFCKVLYEEEKQLRYVEEADYNKIAESTELEIAEVLETIKLARKIKNDADKIKYIDLVEKN